VHEALDQFGSLFGPLLVSAVLASKGDYRLAFLTLFIPATLTLALIVTARFVYPHPEDLEVVAPDVAAKGLPGIFWIYLAGTALVAAGFVDFSIMAFHFQKASVVSRSWISAFYSAAMGVSGIGSLLSGRLFDRIGIKALVPLTALTTLSAPVQYGAAWRSIMGPWNGSS